MNHRSVGVCGAEQIDAIVHDAQNVRAAGDLTVEVQRQDIPSRIYTVA
jgi:hypothetical protein